MLVSTHVRLRLVLLTGTILGSLSAGPALAQDATWTGAASNVFGDAGNWTPAGTPSGTAFFGSTGGTTVSIDSNRALGGFTFNPQANSYIISNRAELRFSGTGIINNSGQIQILNNQNVIYFQNSAVAGATIINGGVPPRSYVFFQDTSTAGTAAIHNNPDGSVVFDDSSTAGNATITNGRNASLGFIGSSTAGYATIRNNPGGSLQFAVDATAGNATIDNSGTVYFFNTSSGGNATVRNNAGAYLEFASSSTAANATIDNSGTLRFWLNASAGNARLITNAGGTTLFQGKSHDTVGSIAGAGDYALSMWSLTTGGNGDTTTVSGAISGGGALVKTGTGTLTLSGANTYTGGTTVNAGKLVVNGSIASAVTVNGGSLGGSGTVGGIAVGNGATVAPGNSIGTLTVNGNVSFGAGSTYQVEVNAAGLGDRINASGMATLSGAAVQVLAATGHYAASTNYTILTATGGVSGQFASVTSNLAFLTPSLAYDTQNVTLTMARNDTSFGPGGDGGDAGGGTYIARTRNQSGIAVAAERLGLGNPVYDTLVSATADEARRAGRRRSLGRPAGPQGPGPDAGAALRGALRYLGRGGGSASEHRW
ncbi:autotransporter-associated beta strand repeat-containing protein [Bosea sp. TAF32]|uniref:autotransporter-associated beta strand repeat-containing protein n=1 Tax=Bosea sp. TAF32 TaxID=3237482 RepID=UPI003F91C0F2